MKKPLKIIFDDESVEEFDDCDVLEYVDDHEITSYAEWNLDMRSEDEGDDRGIDDFTDDEIIDELLHRYRIQKDIVSMGRINEFLNNFYT